MSSDPFIGEIATLPYTFAPKDYVYCTGGLMPISQNPALYAIIGTTYGGDGRTTMAAPNLKSRAPIGVGQGPGLTPRYQGYPVGTLTVALTHAQIPSHDHTWKSYKGDPNATDGNVPKDTRVTTKFTEPNPAGGVFRKEAYVKAPTSYTPLSTSAVSNAGSSHAHTNLQPMLGLSYFMAVQGTFPSRN